MTIKILVVALLFWVGLKYIYPSISTPKALPETPIDKAWWDGLSEEWKTILRINQFFYRHQVDFFEVQKAYMNRLSEVGTEEATALNTGLRDLNNQNRFVLSYRDLYARVLQTQTRDNADRIELEQLHLLDKIYMVGGPGDLTPLKKLPGLKVLIANYCAVNHALPEEQKVLDLEPIRNLKQLEHLQCVTPALKTLDPVKDLLQLRYLDCSNSDVHSLAPLKNLHHLRHLSFGSKVENAAAVAHLHQLENLFIDGCKNIPDLSQLSRLKQLCIVENELALVNKKYQIRDIDFLRPLSSLEFLDFELSSYRGSLEALNGLSRLKAVSLPRVSTADMQAFQQAHPSCVVLNAYAW
jgi:hypothetical protein